VGGNAMIEKCPFCGGTEMTVMLGVFDNPTYVLCEKCRAQGPAKESESEQVAINAWNKRTKEKAAERWNQRKTEEGNVDGFSGN
jgi:Lar family restriction alleviation protein